MRTLQKLLRLLLRCTAASVPLFIASAAEIPNPLGTGATYQTILDNLNDFAIKIVGPISTLMVLVAAYLYITGGGDPAKIKKAHTTLIWALVGIGVVLLASSAEFIIRNLLTGR